MWLVGRTLKRQQNDPSRIGNIPWEVTATAGLSCHLGVVAKAPLKFSYFLSKALLGFTLRGNNGELYLIPVILALLLYICSKFLSRNKLHGVGVPRVKKLGNTADDRGSSVFFQIDAYRTTFVENISVSPYRIERFEGTTQ